MARNGPASVGPKKVVGTNQGILLGSDEPSRLLVYFKTERILL